MVGKGKPDPEIWLKLERGIEGEALFEECLVVEDGSAGVEGAVAAGMRSALLLPKTHAQAIPIKNVSDIVEFL